MLNDAYPMELTFYEISEPYRGYIIERAASKSTAEPGRWVGHYRARKDGSKTLSASIANLQDDKTLAEEVAVEHAKARVDDALAGQN